MKVLLEAGAVDDIERARAWYLAQEVDALDDLSERFEAAVAEAVARIRSFPEAYPVLYRDARRIRLQTFPYNLYYRLSTSPTAVIVVACTHAKQQAHHWKSRF